MEPNEKEQPPFDEVEIQLTDRQELFCKEYIRNKFNGAKAATKAGYSKNNAREQASRLLTNANIKKRVEALKRDLGVQIGIDAAMIATEYAKVAFFDIAKIYTKEGVLKPIHEIDKKSRSAISAIKVMEVWEGFGDDRIQIGETKEVKLWNKIDSLEKLARMIGADGVTKSEVVITDNTVEVKYTDA